MKATTLEYLPHLDGLRALALTYVLLFHFRVFGATGGYLGVDIFLVLSGFLMTRIIRRDVASGTFSMSGFLIRRFWRLYPLLLVTVAITLLISLLVFTPKLQEAVGKSSAFALLFSSNMYFLNTEGYFDITAELKPLLHTWSLSLEEQFYFVWPLFIRAINHRFGNSQRILSIAFAIVTIASLICAWCIGARGASTTFFSLPTRMFEFTLGGLLSVHYNHLTAILQRTRIHHVTAFLGLVLVNYAVFSPSESKLPGFSSLPTLFGTSLLIASPNSFISQHFLATSHVRFIANLSYASYLVHWPIWVYSLFVFDTEGNNNVNKPSIFVLTFSLAYVLHNTVENPLRYKRSFAKCTALFSLLAFTLMLSLCSVVTQGYNEARSVPNTNRMFEKSRQYNQMPCRPLPRDHSIFKPLHGQEPPQHCYIGPAPVHDLPLPISTVLIGSSFANHLIPAFRLLALQRNESYLIFYHHSCPLLSDESHPWPWVIYSCYSDNRKRMRVLSNLPSQHVLLADYWHLRFIQLRGESALTDARTGAFQYFRSVCKNMHSIGHNVTVIGDTPVMGERHFESALSCYVLREMVVRRTLNWLFGFADECLTSFKKPIAQGRMNDRLKSFFENERSMRGCSFLDQFPAFCEEDEDSSDCILTIPPEQVTKPEGANVQSLSSDVIYWEGVHLNNQGAWHASKAIGSMLQLHHRRWQR